MCAEFLVVAVGELKTHDGGFHQGRGHTYGVEIVILLYAVHYRFGCDCVAQSPAGDRIGLGKARTAYCALPHARETVHVDVLVSVIDDVLVDLVHDCIDIVLHAELCYQRKLFH